MKHESEYKKIFVVEQTEESFGNWLNKPYISPELRASLEEANLLIIPNEGFRENSGPIFPDGTTNFYDFLKDNSGQDLVPEICIGDEDYQELALHWDLITIGSVIVSALVAPIAVNVISEFINSLWGNKEINVKFELTIIEKEGDSTHILYQGPASEFQKTISPALKKLGG